MGTLRRRERGTGTAGGDGEPPEVIKVSSFISQGERTAVTLAAPRAHTVQVVLVAKNLPASAGDTRDAGSIPGLGGSLEEETATHSSILAWKIPLQRSLVGYSPWGARSRTRLSARAHVCVFQLSYNKKTASLRMKTQILLVWDSLHYPSASRGRECPLRGYKTPRTHAQPHICKLLRAPTGQLFKGHLWISRKVKKKYSSAEACFFFLLSAFVCLCSSPLCSRLSASTQKSSCPGSLQLLFPGRCHFFSSTKVQAWVKGFAERTPDSRDQRKKHPLRMDDGRKIWAGGNRGARQSTFRMPKLLLRFEARFITYSWGSTSRSEKTASAKALQWRRGA